MISQSAIDFIIAKEVSSKAYYIRHYQRPEWPGGASGVTIAIGYDLGYASVTKIINDWSPYVSEEMLEVLKSCSGVKGYAARALLPSVKNQILIPWDAAYAVFLQRDIPQWTVTVCHALLNTDKIGPTCLGVLVSLAYNRGAGGFHSTAERFAEMHNISGEMAACNFPPVADELRSMKRLWPTMKGLRDRREEEAALWERGLALYYAGHDTGASSLPATPPAYPDPEIPVKEGPARTKPPATTPAQHGTTGAIIVASGGAAAAAAHHGFPMSEVIAIAVFGIVVAAAAFTIWYRNRNPK